MLEYYNQRLMAGAIGTLKNQITNRTAISSIHAVSHGNTDHIENLSTDNLCHILAKNLIIFCSYPQDVSDAEVKSNGQINLDEISRQKSIQAVAL